MKNQLLNLAYYRKRERKSLLFVLSVLLFSSFVDEAYFVIKDMVITDKEYRENQTNLVATLEDQEETKDIQTEKSEIFPISESNSIETNQVNYMKKTHRPSKTRPVPKETLTSPIFNERLTSPPEEEINSWNKIASSHSIIPATSPIPPAPKNILPKSTTIDANNPDIEDLETLGIKNYVINNWEKYIKAGGTFRSLADLEKIYGLEEKDIQSLKEHIKFPEMDEPESNTSVNPGRKIPSPININEATALDFARLPGIGPVLSERIIKFRDKLGGFHSSSQIREVYGIAPELVDKYQNLFTIQIEHKRIKINECSEQELASHPYCNYRFAKIVINYRAQHGSFRNSKDLLKIRTIDTSWVQKIEPYFIF